MDSNIVVMLLSSIFSWPMNADWVVVSSAAKMVKDAVSIRGFMSGRWKMFVAMKLESRKQMRERDKPVASLKSSPATRMFFTFAVLFSDLYWAVYFIIAEFTP